jgi:hypothetical protein
MEERILVVEDDRALREIATPVPPANPYGGDEPRRRRG